MIPRTRIPSGLVLKYCPKTGVSFPRAAKVTSKRWSTEVIIRRYRPGATGAKAAIIPATKGRRKMSSSIGSIL
jgi:hypothetical protein